MPKLAVYAAVVAAWASSTAIGHAQFRPGAGGIRPTVSPYLNLATGRDPAIQYYGVVRPQLNVNRAIQNINSDINYLETNPNLPVQTGHHSTFMTQGRYFMNNGSGGVSSYGSNQLAFRPGTVAGSNTITGGNQSGQVGAGNAGRFR